MTRHIAGLSALFRIAKGVANEAQKQSHGVATR